MITLYKRGSVWWAQSTLHGFQRKWSLRTRDRSVAQELLRQAQIDSLSAPAHRVKKWEDFRKEFLQIQKSQVAEKTYSEYDRVLKIFSEFLSKSGIQAMHDLNPLTIAAFTDIRRHSVHRINRRLISPGGLKFEQRLLHHTFNFAIKRGIMHQNPVTLPNRNATPGKTLPFTPGEVRAMTSSAYLNDKPYLKAVVLLFLHTGLRIGDVISLQRRSIIGNTLTVNTKKRNKVVRLELHPDVLASLRIHFAAQNKAQQKSPYVFSTEFGKPIVSLDKHLRRLWKFCNIPGGHAHRFRDTLAVRLLEAGASLYDVAKILGNSHQVVELHYAPYVKELQERSARLLKSLSFTAQSPLS